MYLFFIGSVWREQLCCFIHVSQKKVKAWKQPLDISSSSMGLLCRLFQSILKGTSFFACPQPLVMPISFRYVQYWKNGPSFNRNIIGLVNDLTSEIDGFEFMNLLFFLVSGFSLKSLWWQPISWGSFRAIKLWGQFLWERRIFQFRIHLAEKSDWQRTRFQALYINICWPFSMKDRREVSTLSIMEGENIEK